MDALSSINKLGDANNQSINYEKIIDIFYNHDIKLILMDAYPSERTIEIMRAVNRNIKFEKNEYKPHKDNIYNIYLDIDQLAELMAKDIKNGLNIIFPCDKRKTLKDIWNKVDNILKLTGDELIIIKSALGLYNMNIFYFFFDLRYPCFFFKILIIIKSI